MFDSRYYLGFSDLLRNTSLGLNPAELQACLCAHLSIDHDCSVDTWLQRALATESGLAGLDTNVMQALEALFELTQKQLTDPEFGFQLFLPDEDVALEERINALSDWCGAFLSAIGGSESQTMMAMDEDGHEFIRDVSEIAKANSMPDNAEELENFAFFEVTEYLRVGTLLLFESMQQAAAVDDGIE